MQDLQELVIRSYMEIGQISRPPEREIQAMNMLREHFEQYSDKIEADTAQIKIGFGTTGNLFINIPAKDGHTGLPLIITTYVDSHGSHDVDIRGDDMYGGGADAGVGIAVAMSLADCLKDLPAHRPLQFVFTVQHEAGMKGGRHIDHSKVNQNASAVVMLTGPEPRDLLRRVCAHANLTLTATGKAAHPGFLPGGGEHAGVLMVKALANLKAYNILSAETGKLPIKAVTNLWNMVIKQGGENGQPIASNEVPDWAQAKISLRTFDGDELKMILRFCKDVVKRCAPTITLDYDIHEDDGEVSHDHPFVQQINSLLQKHGQQMRFADEVFMVGSEQFMIHPDKSTPALAIGCGFRKPHSPEEHAHIPDMVTTLNVMLDLVQASK